ncbi:MAG: hypothetical protein ACYTF0_07895 [Planctomycetota bacterium]|jgi:hypothetical protein
MVAAQNINQIAAACGVLIDLEAESGFAHCATAWQIAPGEWVTAWHEEQRPPGLALLEVASGAVHAIGDWEQDGVMVGFTTAQAAASVLPVVENVEEVLHKRDALHGLAYPSVIDHPQFRLHRGSLDGERYHPYLCPWLVSGHLALFTASDGFLAGSCYPGMAGGPVLNDQGHVVGVILGGDDEPGSPPLTRFRRLA